MQYLTVFQIVSRGPFPIPRKPSQNNLIHVKTKGLPHISFRLKILQFPSALHAVLN